MHGHGGTVGFFCFCFLFFRSAVLPLRAGAAEIQSELFLEMVLLKSRAIPRSQKHDT